MAKKSMIARDKKRIAAVERASKGRNALKEVIRKGSPEEQDAAMLTLQKRPRNESPSRVRNRCDFCGRPHGVYKKFRLCRVHLREAWADGLVPGLTKASW